MNDGTVQVERTAPTGTVAPVEPRPSAATVRTWTTGTALTSIKAFPMVKDGNGHLTTPRPEEAIP